MAAAEDLVVCLFLNGWVLINRCAIPKAKSIREHPPSYLDRIGREEPPWGLDRQGCDTD